MTEHPTTPIGSQARRRELLSLPLHPNPPATASPLLLSLAPLAARAAGDPAQGSPELADPDLTANTNLYYVDRSLLSSLLVCIARLQHPIFIRLPPAPNTNGLLPSPQ